MSVYDGPTVEEWFRARGVTDAELSASQQRRLREWKQGGTPSEESVDAICTRVGSVMLHEVPTHPAFAGLELVERPVRCWIRKAA